MGDFNSCATRHLIEFLTKPHEDWSKWVPYESGSGRNASPSYLLFLRGNLVLGGWIRGEDHYSVRGFP